MARRRAAAPAPVLADAPVQAAVASAVVAHPEPDGLRAVAGDFAAWAEEAHGAQVSAQEAGELLEGHRAALEREVGRARRNARLFTRGGTLRPARYRHGAEFCPRCARHKDYRKECPHCGEMELTF
ncbi:MAG TPA: hypothetical protein VGB42_08340 [Candidatus Thermoplasmatota archaeon]